MAVKQAVSGGGTRLDARRRARAAVAVLGLGLGLGAVAIGSVSTPTQAAGVTVTVDSVGDEPDAAPGDGVCAVAVSGACTLRAAIAETEALAGPDRIEFAIAGGGVQRIVVTEALPVIADAGGVTIDGYTQPGSRPNASRVGFDAVIAVEVVGAGPNGFVGFDLRGRDTTIRGLAIFEVRNPVRIQGAAATGNSVVGNVLGSDAAALFAQPTRVPGAAGVYIAERASDNEIGRAGAQNRNLIAGNADHGVAVYNTGTDRNLIRNNVFGLSRDGSSRVMNHGHGVDINFSASDNVVGGSEGEGNVISGSGLSGVEISHDAPGSSTSGNVVVGNLVGTTPDGERGPAYARNAEFGVNLEGKGRCADSCTPDTSFNEVRGNVIVGSQVNVMIWKASHDNVVTDNTIGVLADGSVAASSASTQWAVLVSAGAFDNQISRNTVAGVQRGIHIRPDNIFPSPCRASDGVCPADAVFPTFGNTVSANSIDRISGGLGIDLYELDSASGNWVDGPSTAPGSLTNGGIGLPTILSAASGSIIVETCAGCTVELFSTTEPDCTSCWLPYGRGRDLLGAVIAGDDGIARITAAQATPGTFVSATATDAAGNTSEFSLRVEVGLSERIFAGASATAPAVRCSISPDC